MVNKFEAIVMDAPCRYAQRDTEDLCDFYTRHVEAMTAEGLHEKNAIAAELAWRDRRIAGLHAESARLRVALADAIRRPLGVVPASAEGLVTADELDAAERRPPRG